MWGQDCEHGRESTQAAFASPARLGWTPPPLRRAWTRIEQFCSGLRELRRHWLRDVLKLAEEGLDEHLLQWITCLLGMSTLKFR